MKKSMLTVLALLLLAAGFMAACTRAPQSADRDAIITYRDIPGISNDDIEAVGRLREQNRIFTIGTPHLIEAFENRHSEIEGFTPLLAEWLSNLFGLRFQTVIMDLGDVLSGLSTGEVSFGTLAITPERYKTYYISDPIIRRMLSILRIKDTPSPYTIAPTRTPRFIFMTGATTYASALEALEPGAFEAFFVDSYDMAYRMMKNGEADAMVVNNAAEAAFDIYGDVVVEDFLPLSITSIALMTGCEQLAPIISILDKAMEAGAYEYLVELYRRGYQDYKRHKFQLVLNEDELAFLRDHSVIPFATQYMSYPASFYNMREGIWEGIVFDVMEEIAWLTGLTFDMVNTPTTELPDLLDMLEDGTAHFMPNVIQTDERRERFIFSQAYLPDRYALLSKRSFPNIEVNDIPFLRVGFARGSAFAEMFNLWFPDAMFAVQLPNTDAVFAALDRGDIDLAMSSLSRLASLTNYYEYSDYKANYVFNAIFEGSFAFNKEQEILRSIFDKALPLIDTVRISDQWLTKTYNIEATRLRAQLPWFIGAIALAACVIVLIGILLLRSRDSASKLETLVEQRTHELKLASEAKSTFLANMSHEIRTPMNAVLGMAEILLVEDLTDSQRSYAEDIKVSALALLELINDILDLSKIQAGKLLLDPVHYSFSAMIDNINSLISLLAGNKQLTYTYTAEPGIPEYLYGDDYRLRQVLLNILGNAVKFTFTGGVVFTVKPHDGNLIFTISDTGIGIKKEDVQKMFEAFSQASTQQIRVASGTGLGLSISKNLIEMMKGTISLESEYGKGTTFTITIPMIRGDGTRLAEEEEVKPIYAPDASVLVVDDNAINLNVACGFLKLCQITTDTALSGAKAIEMMEQKAYDIVFMDHMMPDMDGVETTKIIRQMGHEKPIIALTANAILGMEETFLEAGMNDMLIKPIEKAKMFKILADWLPPEKVSYVNPNPAQYEEEGDISAFWQAVHGIEGLDADTGLEHVFGQRDNYENSLRLMITEINKCNTNLKAFLYKDAANFEVLAHSIKGSLANIGAAALAKRANTLEEAAGTAAWEVCETELIPFLDDLLALRDQIQAAFALNINEAAPIEIPQELAGIFEQLKTAFEEMDFMAIDRAIEQLDALALTGSIGETIALIKEAVTIMDFDGAVQHMGAVSH